MRLQNPAYCVLWAPTLATSPGAERVAASTGTGAGTGGAISSQSVTLAARALTGDSSLDAVTFLTAISVGTASGADSMRCTDAGCSVSVTGLTIMRSFDTAARASAPAIFLSVKMAGGFCLIANVSYSDIASRDTSWITLSSLALFCAQTLAAGLLSTNHVTLMAAALTRVAVFSRLTTQPVLSMAVSLIQCLLAKHMPWHAFRCCYWVSGKLTGKPNQKRDENVS
jgi:hypothetical protein